MIYRNIEIHQRSIDFFIISSQGVFTLWYRFLKSEENDDEGGYEYGYEKHKPNGIRVFNKHDEEIWFLKLPGGDDGTQLNWFVGNTRWENFLVK